MLPTAVLCSGLAHLPALRGRVGFGAFAERLTCLLDPFAGSSLIVIAAADAEERELLHAVLRERPGSYLLPGTTHGEAFADARCRPSMELWAPAVTNYCSMRKRRRASLDAKSRDERTARDCRVDSGVLTPQARAALPDVLIVFARISQSGALLPMPPPLVTLRRCRK